MIVVILIELVKDIVSGQEIIWWNLDETDRKFCRENYKWLEFLVFVLLTKGGHVGVDFNKYEL